MRWYYCLFGPALWAVAANRADVSEHHELISGDEPSAADRGGGEPSAADRGGGGAAQDVQSFAVQLSCGLDSTIVGHIAGAFCRRSRTCGRDEQKRDVSGGRCLPNAVAAQDVRGCRWHVPGTRDLVPVLRHHAGDTRGHHRQDYENSPADSGALSAQFTEYKSKIQSGTVPTAHCSLVIGPAGGFGDHLYRLWGGSGGRDTIFASQLSKTLFPPLWRRAWPLVSIERAPTPQENTSSDSRSRRSLSSAVLTTKPFITGGSQGRGEQRSGM